MKKRRPTGASERRTAASQAEKAERLEFCRRLTVRCVPDAEVARLAAEKFGVTRTTAGRWVQAVRNTYRVAASRQLSLEEIGAHRSEQMDMVREVVSKAWQEIAALEHRSQRILKAERTLEMMLARLGEVAGTGEILARYGEALREFMGSLEGSHKGRTAQMGVILQAIRLMADLTGTSIQKVELTGSGGGPVEILNAMSDDELDTFLRDQGVQLTLHQGGRSETAGAAAG